MGHRRAHVIVGLGFGDEGKGATVDFLTRQLGAKLIVRYNGGAQAAHNVVTPDGVHHTFAQFGSGMLCNDPQIRTFLSRHMVIHPAAIFNEAKHLEEIGVINPLERLIIDERALVITPYHQATNRLREIARGDNWHGSCGVGVGEAVSDEEAGFAIYAGDLPNINVVMEKLAAIREYKAKVVEHIKVPEASYSLLRLFQDNSSIYKMAEDFKVLAKHLTIYPWYRSGDVFEDEDDVIFEGAQGVLLDEKWGFYPYTTWSNCTTENAYNIIDHDADWQFNGRIKTYGVVRAYGTRHGPGPFPTEDARLFMELRDSNEHNKMHEWQGRFRIGWFDGVLARYALKAAGRVDKLVITNLDRLQGIKDLKICRAYDIHEEVIPNLPVHHISLNAMRGFGEMLSTHVTPIYDTVDYKDLVSRIEKEMDMKAQILSFGPTWKDRKEIQ